MISRLGKRVLDSKKNLNQLAVLINQTAYWLVVGPFRPKGFKWRWTIRQVVQTGREAVPIVTLIAAAIGMILALQTAYQLRRVGALTLVATLVAVSVVRELGPLITAIIVAGRSGSAFAAEIASMVVAEEVDAMRTMGLHPVKFLVAPKVMGLVIALPCLTLIADLVAILGGMAVGVLGLHINMETYYKQSLLFLEVADVINGLIKSVFFALIIALVGCYQGVCRDRRGRGRGPPDHLLGGDGHLPGYRGRCVFHPAELSGGLMENKDYPAPLIIETRDLVARYGSRTILDNLSIGIPPGADNGYPGRLRVGQDHPDAPSGGAQPAHQRPGDSHGPAPGRAGAGG